MSRDWTPKELYYADKKFHFRDQKITMTDSNGNEIDIGPDREDKDKFPNLSFLGEGVLNLMKEAKLTDEEIQMFEKELKTIVDNEDIGILASNWLRADVDETLRLTAQWFEGKLDPAFYYRERNDEVYAEKAADLIREPTQDKNEIFMLIVAEIRDAVSDGILHADPNNSNNILVYRAAGTGNPEGWYSENILSVAGDLASNPSHYQDFHNAIVNAQNKEDEYDKE